MFHLTLSSPPPRLFTNPNPHLHAPPVPTNSISTSPFLGQRLNLHLRSNTKPTRRAPLLVTAEVKWRKERPFDNVIEKDKKLKLVLKIRRILVNQPDRTMSLRDIGKYRNKLGLTRNRRIIALLKRFPAVFEIIEEGVYSLKFRLTPEAERIYLEELMLRNGSEELLVTKLRKLLMMSLEKRILIEKIAHLKTDLGLPLEFLDTICQRYPEYFQVVPTARGPMLELTSWDPELAVSVAEVNAEEERAREIEERNLIIDRPPRFTRAKLPKGLNLSKKEMRTIRTFNDVPYISPYLDFSQLQSGTLEKEKHACGVVHEILSLTLEKRTLVDHLTHLKQEFRFSQQLRGMFLRHPDMFYVSKKGARDSVFLREAYRDSQLIEKDRLLVLKEKMRALVAVPRSRRRFVGVDGGSPSDEVSEEDSGADDDEEWSDVDSVLDGMSDDVDADEGDGEDNNWSDEDDETPPEFDEDVASPSPQRSKVIQSVKSSSKTEEKDRVPVMPDGRPRERW